MTHFQKTLNRLDAAEKFIWMLLILLVALLIMGEAQEDQTRFRVKADNNSRQAQEEKMAVVSQLELAEMTQVEDALYPPKRVGFSITPQGYYASYELQLEDGRGDNFWCILVKNSCYDEKDVEEPKSFIVMLWNRWFSTDEDDTHPQDGDKITKQEG